MWVMRDIIYNKCVLGNKDNFRHTFLFNVTKFYLFVTLFTEWQNVSITNDIIEDRRKNLK